jgi:hypothetical protein
MAVANYIITKDPDFPVLCATLLGNFSMQRDVLAYVKALEAALNRVDEPVFFITDASELSVNFTEMVMGIATVTSGIKESRAVVQHRNIREMIVIAKDRLVTLGARAMKQSQYGGLMVASFSSLEDAYQYIHQQIPSPN